MNENIWPIVGRPRTTHDWTIKIQFLFFIFYYYYFFYEWEYFNKSRPRQHMVEQ